jgi:Cu+-exporting ATPase
MYIAHAEFRRQGSMSDVLYRTSITVPGPATDPSASTDPAVTSRHGDIRAVTSSGVTVRLLGTAEVGQTSGEDTDFTLRFTDTATGDPLEGLKPYLGAAGHIVILRSDGTRFAHAHAETSDGDGRPTFATPGSTFGPDLGFHTRFETAGTYRLWGQFRLPNGHVITTAFTVHPHTDAQPTAHTQGAHR